VAIEAAGYYMARLRQTWRERRSTEERHDLALASYNAGIGNMLAAQQACGGARAYSAIVECLPAVTGRHASETIAYVKAVHRWFALMEARP
jgi:membrane-bound lytic murein transglycosylase F